MATATRFTTRPSACATATQRADACSKAAGATARREALIPQTGELQIFVSIPRDLLIELVFDADSLPPN